jgi:hypothetical protein
MKLYQVWSKNNTSRDHNEQQLTYFDKILNNTAVPGKQLQIVHMGRLHNVGRL